jgi:uncharacterized protein (DUF58 family)
VTLLSAQELDSLERLALATRSRQIGFFTGDHRSRRFGSSVDFADHREYRPGDDFRRIDTALSARMDKLFLKLFEAEEDLSVRIVLDLSSSMDYGDKHTQARRIAAAFVHLALVQHDRARVYIASAGGVQTSRWWRGRAGVNEAMGWLSATTSAGAAGPVEALRAIRDEGRKGIVIVISDLLFEGWEEVPRLASTLGEPALVQILSGEELEPSLEGDLTLVDEETGAEIPIAADAATLDAYRARVTAFTAGVRSACAARGLAYALARSDAELMDLFMRAFRSEAVVR